jgi:hypothetical protein
MTKCKKMSLYFSTSNELSLTKLTATDSSRTGWMFLVSRPLKIGNSEIINIPVRKKFEFIITSSHRVQGARKEAWWQVREILARFSTYVHQTYSILYNQLAFQTVKNCGLWETGIARSLIIPSVTSSSSSEQSLTDWYGNSVIQQAGSVLQLNVCVTHATFLVNPSNQDEINSM